MLISHRYKFIFIKTVKTAGTSIEVELSKLLGDEDVVTQVGPSEPGHVPRNFVINGIRMSPHSCATEVRQAVGSELFNSYTKFCVERESVDKCISHYSMLKNSPAHNTTGRDLSWRRYMRKRQFPKNHRSYLSFTGHCLVDHILRYENLDKEIADLLSRLGLRISGIRTRAKSGHRDKSLTVENICERDRRIIYRAFRRTARHTGYLLDDLPEPIL